MSQDAQNWARLAFSLRAERLKNRKDLPKDFSTNSDFLSNLSNQNEKEKKPMAAERQVLKKNQKSSKESSNNAGKSRKVRERKPRSIAVKIFLITLCLLLLGIFSLILASFSIEKKSLANQVNQDFKSLFKAENIQGFSSTAQAADQEPSAGTSTAPKTNPEPSPGAQQSSPASSASSSPTTTSSPLLPPPLPNLINQDFYKELYANLNKKELQLQERERALDEKERSVEILKKDLEKILEEAKKERQMLEETLTQQKALLDEKLKHLVKVYEAMKPNNAAQIMAKMEDPDVIAILSNMKGKPAAKILDSMSALDSQRAASLTEKIRSSF